jgi:hypothetical protein
MGHNTHAHARQMAGKEEQLLGTAVAVML